MRVQQLEECKSKDNKDDGKEYKDKEHKMDQDEEYGKDEEWVLYGQEAEKGSNDAQEVNTGRLPAAAEAGDEANEAENNV